jgi:hypothetical protein
MSKKKCTVQEITNHNLFDLLWFVLKTQAQILSKLNDTDYQTEMEKIISDYENRIVKAPEG